MDSVPKIKSKAKTHYIYTLSHAISGDVFYVGKSTNPKSRFYVHMRNAKTGVDTMPVYDVIRTIIEQGRKPTLTVIDQITTIHEKLAFKMEGAYRWALANDGNKLANVKRHGYGGRHESLPEYIKTVKGFAFVPEEKLSELLLIEMREAANGYAEILEKYMEAA